MRLFGFRILGRADNAYLLALFYPFWKDKDARGCRFLLCGDYHFGINQPEHALRTWFPFAGEFYFPVFLTLLGSNNFDADFFFFRLFVERVAVVYLVKTELLARILGIVVTAGAQAEHGKHKACAIIT